MSSHREAPSISKDGRRQHRHVRVGDSGQDRHDRHNYVPGEIPANGPNFYEFGDDVLYEINIDNNADAEENVVYQFRFTTVISNPNTFLYNTGPITSLTSANWNRRQRYSVTKSSTGRRPCSRAASPARRATWGPLHAELRGTRC